MAGFIERLLPRRKIGGIEILRDPTRTFADEYGVRDTLMSPSEQRIVKDALDKLGIKATHTPTGRYVEIALHECLERSVRNATVAKLRGQKGLAAQWWAAARKAEAALKLVPRQEAS